MLSCFRNCSRTSRFLVSRCNRTHSSYALVSNPIEINCINKHPENSAESCADEEIENHSQKKENPYYIEDGLRKVYPYYFDHLTYCKKRWMKRRLIDVYSSEFAVFPRTELERRILSGSVKVNGESVGLDHDLKLSDVLSSRVHRHELPVLAASIKVIFEDENLLVIDKPPSIPVHECGFYRHNSATFILKQEGNWKELHVVHRLDRLTSGVLIFAKTLESSREIHEDFSTLNVTKEYLCRVEGKFPDGVVVCNKPLRHLRDRVGITIVHPYGKTSLTKFEKLSYNGNSSLVKCKLYTGRTHQIRAHLQYLGFPIVNDSVYNSYAFGPDKGKHGEFYKTTDKLLKDVFERRSAEWSVKDDEEEKKSWNPKADNIAKRLFDMNRYNLNVELLSDRYKKDPSRLQKVKDCFFCSNALNDPKPSGLFMFLHAHKYQCKKWEFQTDMPVWASDDWDM